MTLHGDLLDQARHLASVDSRRPRQANLRRAVSAAYYALFHCLTDAGVRHIARANSPAHARSLVRRSFAHSQMAEISHDFDVGARWLAPLGIIPSADLRAVAGTFVVLQHERHAADYAIEGVASYSRAATQALIEQAERALAAWERVRGTPEAEYYILALLVGRPRRGG